MLLSERKVLHSAEFVLAQNVAINFLWKNQILRNGEVISEENHRGSYPVNEDGGFDTTIETVNGLTVAGLMGEVAAQLQLDNAALRASLGASNSSLASAMESLGVAAQRIAELEAQLAAITPAESAASVDFGEAVLANE